MKKIFKKISNWISDENRQESVILALEIIDVIAAICLSCLIAERLNRYLLLTIVSYLSISITLKITNAELICEKLDNFFLRNYKWWNFMHIPVLIITFLLSYRYFLAFALSIPQAIVNGEVNRLKNNTFKQERRVP